MIEYHKWYIMWGITDNEALNELLTNPVNEYLLVKQMGDLRESLDLMADQHNNTIGIYTVR